MKEWILDQLYPENGKCPICDRVLFFTRNYLCGPCMERIEEKERPTCRLCGRARRQNRLTLCFDCLSHTPVFQTGFCCFPYDEDMKELVYAMKFKHRPGLCRAMGGWMGRLLKQKKDLHWFEGKGAIVPVPVHGETLKTRGYNQSEELAKGLLAEWPVSGGKPPVFMKDVLIKNGDGTHQRELNRQERHLHAQKIFQWKNPEPIRGLQILLVDDVLTTGATANACARLLLDAGARSVDLAVFAGVDS